MQMRKRTRYSLLLVLALIVALFLALWLRKDAPPEAARLLPESDAILYANLLPLRAATHFEKPPVTRSEDYQHFIDATGVVAERDLNAVAFGLHKMADPHGPNGPVGYSEVFEGRFDGAKLGRYLASLASAQEDYAGHTIYTIPIDGRPLRITQLGYDTIAASNMPTTEQIHAMLDRYRAAASPLSGSTLLAAHYRDVPLLSGVWAIGHIGLPLSEKGKITVSGVQLPLADDTMFVVSLRLGVGVLKLRIEELAASETEASHSAEELGSMLRMFQVVQPALSGEKPGPNDAELHQFVQSIKVEQEKDRAVLTANMPFDLAKKLAASREQTAP